MGLNQPTQYWRLVGAIATIAGLIVTTVEVAAWKAMESQIPTIAQVSFWMQAVIIGVPTICSVTAVGLTAFF